VRACEDCWAEAGRRQAAGDLRPQVTIYHEVLKEAEKSGTAPWCEGGAIVAREGAVREALKEAGYGS